MWQGIFVFLCRLSLSCYHKIMRATSPANYANPYFGKSLPMNHRVKQAGFVEKQAKLTHVTMNYAEGPANGLPLVLVPAQMGTWHSYYKVLPALSKQFHVFAIDLRGHGGSSWTPDDYNWDSVSGDVAEFIQQVIGRPAIISGNSAGGIVALWCAANASQWVLAAAPEDAPIFSTEMPRFRDHDRFVYNGIQHAVQVLGDFKTRDLANYYDGQIMPVTENYVKKMPGWFVNWLSRKLQQTEARHPGEPIALDQWYMPQVLKLQFNSLKTYDPDFGRAFIDGRMYGNFDHAKALSAVRCPFLVLHADWKRLPSYGLVGAMDDDDAARIQQLVPHAQYRKIAAKHVIHAFKPRAFVQAIKDFALTLGK